jgi:putative membrane protein
MTRIKLWGLACVAGWLLAGGRGWTSDAPMTGTVLGKLHHADQREISMGKLAQKNARSREARSFGLTLVKDHTAADEHVVALAKDEKVNLEVNTPPMSDADMNLLTDADFDASFARAMLDDHQRDITEASMARAATQDDKLRDLLDELLPVMRRHRDTAQTLVDGKILRASR